MSGKLKVLVVDDNVEFCANVIDILELKGYEASAAYDGYSALELVKEDGFDLVLMDIKMPVMDGVDTFKRLKQIAPHTPVIMITAYAVEDLIRKALKEGAFASLKKPLDFNQLFNLIEQVINTGAMILIVDDDKDLCTNMKDMLQDKGYQVTVAYDGDVAIEQAQKNNFDIMLLDLKLPVLNGLETYLAIREFRTNVVAIMITGYQQQMTELAQQALNKGAYTCLEKPIDMDQLVELLKHVKQQQDKGTLKKPE